MKLHKRNSLINSKEAAKRYQLIGGKRVFEFFFNRSNLPVVHRADNGNKNLIEKDTFLILKEITDIALEKQGEDSFFSKKEKVLNKITLFAFIVEFFEFDKNNPRDQKFELLLAEQNLNSILTIDGKFESFELIEYNSNKVYKFGKQSQSPNGSTTKLQPRKVHTVKGFWRNQPVGSRNNPSYKRIWIDEFQRAS